MSEIEFMVYIYNCLNVNHPMRDLKTSTPVGSRAFQSDPHQFSACSVISNISQIVNTIYLINLIVNGRVYDCRLKETFD